MSESDKEYCFRMMKEHPGIVGALEWPIPANPIVRMTPEEYERAMTETWREVAARVQAAVEASKYPDRSR